MLAQKLTADPKLHLLLTLKSCPAVMTGSKVQEEEAGSVDAGRTSKEDGEFRRCCLTMPPYLAVSVYEVADVS